METDIARDLDITLETALMLSEGKSSVRKIAESIYESEAEMLEQFRHPWMVDRIVWMLKRRQSKIAQGQLALPGFENLPRRITVKGGHRAALRFATLRELKEYRAILWKQEDKRVKTLDRLIELVASYAVENPNIRAQEAMEMEAKRRTF